jgi:hypothetical protein
VYNHFQYKADDEDQLLRSPACSWYDRYNGIDCKSYSILASSILLELGINHYIRKIKQPTFAPDEFTHVYVVVPKDQKTNDLNKGYYIIDGTVTGNYEPEYIETKDEYMNGLQHYSLNGTPGLKSTAADEPKGTLNLDFLKNIDFKYILNLLKTPIDCWGGTAYSSERVTADITSVTNFCVKLLNEMNAAQQAGNMALFSEKVSEYFGMTAVFVQSVALKRAEKKWNSCSMKGFDATAEACTFYATTIAAALDVYLDMSFVGTVSGSKTYTQTMGIAKQGLNDFAGYTTPVASVTRPFEIFKKTSPLPVPNFQVTEYVYSLVTTPNNFDPATYFEDIKALYEVAGTIGGSIGGSGGTSFGGHHPAGFTPVTTQKAGIGTIGYVAIGAAVIFGAKTIFENMKNTKK